MLISSANLSRKKGAASPAQIRKNFGRQLEAMVDTGDLPEGVPSTLVELTEEGYSIKREGAVAAADIERVWTK
jgi:tRNA A37 threonylcarbamoyladenosine synthetase subunit TsaC/SUA5/YrdC